MIEWLNLEFLEYIKFQNVQDLPDYPVHVVYYYHFCLKCVYKDWTTSNYENKDKRCKKLIQQFEFTSH